jgi:hypothetical protein
MGRARENAPAADGKLRTICGKPVRQSLMPRVKMLGKRIVKDL